MGTEGQGEELGRRERRNEGNTRMYRVTHANAHAYTPLCLAFAVVQDPQELACACACACVCVCVWGCVRMFVSSQLHLYVFAATNLFIVRVCVRVCVWVFIYRALLPVPCVPAPRLSAPPTLADASVHGI
jgi:hypothetical protein